MKRIRDPKKLSFIVDSVALHRCGSMGLERMRAVGVGGCACYVRFGPAQIRCWFNHEMLSFPLWFCPTNNDRSRFVWHPSQAFASSLNLSTQEPNFLEEPVSGLIYDLLTGPDWALSRLPVPQMRHARKMPEHLKESLIEL